MPSDPKTRDVSAALQELHLAKRWVGVDTSTVPVRIRSAEDAAALLSGLDHAIAILEAYMEIGRASCRERV